MAPFFLLQLLLLSQILLCTAIDTINSSTPLSGAQKIVSKGNKFALGFYTPPQGFSDTEQHDNIPVPDTQFYIRRSVTRST
ncbi:hypothetical protein PR202_gb21203 [Eleusine coracana subsp. coracana]|uniref:Uncharacterized protein n=1 Tax=Eleusine coracana subsp. coracana TaxID=191504 RepID=A0AAV5FCM6_ELECO|nr:hypothetical protein PR202_gb21203 [Eleusine coracana subsp. coracana]